jgi:hypothetical protein
MLFGRTSTTCGRRWYADAFSTMLDANSIQGWKGSVKARHLVMAMRDHFGEPSQRVAAAQAAALEKTSLHPDASHPETSSEIQKEAADDMGKEAPWAVEMTAAEDDWALSLIRVHSVQVS